MPIYSVEYRNLSGYAIRELSAATPEDALRLAQASTEALDFEDYPPYRNVEEIVVFDAEGQEELGIWRDHDTRLRCAAPILLATLEQAVKALNTAPCFKVPTLDTDSYRIAALCEDAIATAKGGSQ